MNLIRNNLKGIILLIALTFGDLYGNHIPKTSINDKNITKIPIERLSLGHKLNDSIYIANRISKSEIQTIPFIQIGEGTADIIEFNTPIAISNGNMRTAFFSTSIGFLSDNFSGYSTLEERSDDYLPSLYFFGDEPTQYTNNNNKIFLST